MHLEVACHTMLLLVQSFTSFISLFFQKLLLNLNKNLSLMQKFLGKCIIGITQVVILFSQNGPFWPENLQLDKCIVINLMTCLRYIWQYKARLRVSTQIGDDHNGHLHRLLSLETTLLWHNNKWQLLSCEASVSNPFRFL